MLAVADRQRGFFDAAWCSELLPEDVDLFAAGRAWGSDRPGRGLRRVLLGAPGAAFDSAEPAGEGAAAGLPRGALRRAGDGGGPLRSALEGGARFAARPPRLPSDEPGPLSRSAV